MYFYASNGNVTVTCDERGFEGGIVNLGPDDKFCGHSNETFNRVASGYLVDIAQEQCRIIPEITSNKIVGRYYRYG